MLLKVDEWQINRQQQNQFYRDDRMERIPAKYTK